MRRVALGALALALGLAFAGCGGAGGTTTACTLGTGATRVCLEIWTNVGAPGGSAQAAADCTQGGGVAATACPHDGADGGCRMSVTSGAIMETTTQWFYAGMAAQEMANCAKQPGNTWISP
jgi:putative hemolysin